MWNLEYITDTNTSREYAVPDLTKSALIVNRPMTLHPDFQPPPYCSLPPSVPPPPVEPMSLYSTANVMDIPSIQVF